MTRKEESVLQEKRQKRGISHRAVRILTAVIFAAVFLTCDTLAYLKIVSNKAENRFGQSDASTLNISEQFDGDVKENVGVSVGETGYSVYVRAAVSVTWKNAAGDVLAEAPSLLRNEYSIEYSLTGTPSADSENAGWFLAGDGFYYYRYPVQSGGETSPLITLCRQLADAPKDGYTLCVDIAAQTVQSAGSTDTGDIPAVTDAWGASVGNGYGLYFN